MAFLPENSTFDNVYQIETTDLVVGGPNGVTNTPLKNLTNRTKYLKDQLSSLQAMLNSTTSANTVVQRNASGSFSANVVTASLVGNVTGTLNGNIVATGATVQLSVNGSTSVATFTSAGVNASGFTSNGAGTPTISSATNLVLSAANRVSVSNAPFRIATFTTTQRNALAASNGDMIYNSTDNRFQGYQNGTWVNLS